MATSTAPKKGSAKGSNKTSGTPSSIRKTGSMKATPATKGTTKAQSGKQTAQATGRARKPLTRAQKDRKNERASLRRANAVEEGGATPQGTATEAPKAIKGTGKTPAANKKQGIKNAA